MEPGTEVGDEDSGKHGGDRRGRRYESAKDGQLVNKREIFSFMKENIKLILFSFIFHQKKIFQNYL